MAGRIKFNRNVVISFAACGLSLFCCMVPIGIISSVGQISEKPFNRVQQGMTKHQPHFITLNSGEPMALAGLWESWKSPEGDLIQSCTACTTDANPFMISFHDRMPVILPDAMIVPWLDPKNKTADKLKPILAQFPAGDTQEWPVSKDAGNVRNKGEFLCDPISDQA